MNLRTPDVWRSANSRYTADGAGICPDEQEDDMGQTVLITGASGGLGAEFAGIFAAEGYDLVLTARQTDKMEKLSSRLQEKYPVKITVLFSDLSRPDGAELLYEEIKKRGIRIDQLVNNAGAGKACRTTDADPELLQDLISLNVISVTMLCRLIGADMERQGYGKILNISSSAALFPDPFFNVYGPSKSFILALTEAMRGELAGSGVTVTALCPGPIRTGWAENAGKAYPVLAADPKRIARIGYRAMQRGAVRVLPTVSVKAGIFFLSLLPDPLKVAVGSWWQRAMIKKDKKKNQ